MTTITETIQYSGTVSWSPDIDGSFAADTEYRATITLTPKTGYTLSGVPENFFTVAGASSVTNNADSGIVAAEFPKTPSSNAYLSHLAISTGTLSPNFSPDTSAYTVSVPNATSSITITGTPADASAALSSNNGVAQSLEVGTNEIVITTTVQDGTTHRTYTVTVTRRAFNLDMVYVPPGRFQRDNIATNISEITQPYWIGRYEITRAQWRAIFGDENDPSLQRYRKWQPH